MTKLTFEFDDDEMRLIEDYKQAVGAVDIRVALLNAVSVAIDRVVWDNAFMKRGHWVKLSGFVTPGGDPVWGCSECGKGVHVYGIEASTYGADVAGHQWVSCPNCGAIMDEGITMEDKSVCADCEIQHDFWDCKYCCKKCYEDYGECPDPDCDHAADI